MFRKLFCTVPSSEIQRTENCRKRILKILKAKENGVVWHPKDPEILMYPRKHSTNRRTPVTSLNAMDHYLEIKHDKKKYIKEL